MISNAESTHQKWHKRYSENINIINPD
ncbi:hypothetical protein [Acinetobacter sp. NPDC052428]